ncbi:MAG: DUF424 family protein [Candidatus Micrarchaeota archaeon]|nr:DUF424 family protein [Candidatus Micrarchaeota archaeon]
MYMKVHTKQNEVVVALCDKELIGTVLDDGRTYMDLDTYRNFYVGKISTESEVREALKKFTSANFVGKKAVGIAISLGLVEKNDIKNINKVPYIQVYNI